MQLPVTPRISQKGPALTLTCALDCDYVARLYRGTKLLAGVGGRATGGELGNCLGTDGRNRNTDN